MAIDDAFTDQLEILRVWASPMEKPPGSLRNVVRWNEQSKEFLALDGTSIMDRLTFGTFDDGPTSLHVAGSFTGIPNLSNVSYGAGTMTPSRWQTLHGAISENDLTKMFAKNLFEGQRSPKR